MMEVLENILGVYSSEVINTTTLLAVLAMVLFLAVYEFIVYRFISHKSFYNKSFNIAIAILPFFIATIILCLQSNIVITLGTIGALAIIRFRTAVKDPVDMIYLLWSVHTGIICGCQLYEVAVITSLIVTILLFVLQNLSFFKKPYVLVAHTKKDCEEDLISTLKGYTKHYRIKSRSYTSDGMDYAIEFKSSKVKELTSELGENKKVERFSIIEYDFDDIV